jgi:hypothetical protein
MGSVCADGACAFADVFSDAERLSGSLQLSTEDIAEDDCQVLEGCVMSAGMRDLLRFEITTPNLGEGDLVLGDPGSGDNPMFVFSECHGHYHFESYAAYELIDEAGKVVAPGHKQAFCLMDSTNWGSGEPPVYHCGDQGISKGWADTYGWWLDCQFVDVTDVPPGDYRLRVHLNTESVLAEGDYSNNTTEVPVTLPL